MIGRVLDRVANQSHLALTAVATCDQEIFDYSISKGGNAVMSGNHHLRASARCADALETLERRNKVVYDIVVMVQGDEPMIHPDMVHASLQPLLASPSVNAVNLLGQINSQKEFEDRN